MEDQSLRLTFVFIVCVRECRAGNELHHRFVEGHAIQNSAILHVNDFERRIVEQSASAHIVRIATPDRPLGAEQRCEIRRGDSHRHQEYSLSNRCGGGEPRRRTVRCADGTFHIRLEPIRIAKNRE